LINFLFYDNAALMPNHKKESLEKLTSPEQLDRVLRIVRLPGWIALVSLLLLVLGLFFWSIFGQLPITTEGKGIFFDPRSIELIQSEAEGKVEEVNVKMGDQVRKGEALLKIKLLHTEEIKVIAAPADGKILMVEVLRGEEVRFGTILLWFHVAGREEKDLVYGFFPIAKGSTIQKGMRAQVTFNAISAERYGKMEGKVTEVLPFAASPHGAILQSIPSSNLRDYLTKGEARVVVLIEPTLNHATPSGYQWTTAHGPPFRIPAGSVADLSVFLEEKRPISYLIPIGFNR
jgi:multidrug resistance efflux pump